jgi:hypothetical protein
MTLMREWVATERGGGFSGLNTMPDTDGQPYLTMIAYTMQSWFPNNYFGLDAM